MAQLPASRTAIKQSVSRFIPPVYLTRDRRAKQPAEDSRPWECSLLAPVADSKVLGNLLCGKEPDMRRWRVFLVLLASATSAATAEARNYTFEGPWHTSNRPLDGTMTCLVTDLGNERWQGRFYGVWQGASFDYTVAFTGPPSRLRGTAAIDGANYQWTGEIDAGSSASFKATFTGDRYNGHFDLKEAAKAARNRVGR
jgi:hypothetical protein